MAQKKTNTERISELEKQVASLLGETSAPTKSAKPKSASAKPAAKKASSSTAAKKPAAKTDGQTAKKTSASPAKKPPAKKSAAKPKARPEAEQPDDVAEKPVEVADGAQSQPVVEAEKPVESLEEIAATSEPDTQPAAEEPAPEPEPEPSVEQPVEASGAEDENADDAPTAQSETTDSAAPAAQSEQDNAVSQETAPDVPHADEEKPDAEPAALAEGKKGGKARAFADKANNFVNNKGKLPIFIIANVLLVLSTVLLIVAAFNITTVDLKTVSYNLFTYFGKSAEVKAQLALMAGSWGKGGYIMIGILMILAMLVPLALAVKNVVLCIVKKDRNVYMLDAMISFAFMLAYIGIVNLYGANVTAGHITAFVIATLLVAFTAFAALVADSGKALPVYSMVNIPLIIVAVFLLSATPTLTGAGGPYYGARAAGVCGNGGFSFVMLLVSVFALVLLSVMQLKKLPTVLEIIVPIVSAGCALLAALLFGAGRVSGTSVGGGLIFGVIFDILLAIANVVFTLHPKLKRHKVQIND